ncbi:MAG: hypothetical protein WCA59_15875 [Candidatus Binataceae bacterium]
MVRLLRYRALSEAKPMKELFDKILCAVDFDAPDGCARLSPENTANDEMVNDWARAASNQTATPLRVPLDLGKKGRAAQLSAPSRKSDACKKPSAGPSGGGAGAGSDRR